MEQPMTRWIAGLGFIGLTFLTGCTPPSLLITPVSGRRELEETELSRDSLFIKIKREILRLTHGRAGDQIKLFLSPPVAQYVQERLERLEHAVKHKIVIQPDPTLSWEDYRILIE